MGKQKFKSQISVHRPKPSALPPLGSYYTASLSILFFFFLYSTFHPRPLFKYENLTLFSSLLSYISSPFFNFCIVSTVCLHSESFIYVNTHSIDIQSFNSNECAYCQSSIMRLTCMQNSLLSFLSALFSSLRALLTTQLYPTYGKKERFLVLGQQQTLLLVINDSILSTIWLLQLILWKLT